MAGTARTTTYESIIDMFDKTPLTIPVFDLQSCDGLAPYCRKTCVVYSNHRVRYGQDGIA
jgi:hypothetical protein